jgi:arylsulfatase A-like enzyme
LRLGFGLEDRALRVEGPGKGARFAVAAAEAGAPPRELWAAELNPGARPEDRGWHDVEIALDELAGRAVNLWLITEALGSPAGSWTAWSDPVVVSRGSAAGFDGVPVRAVTLVKDLFEGAEAAASRESACRFTTRIEVPDGGALDFAGQVLSDEDDPTVRLGPVRLQIVIDGETIHERQISSAQSIMTLAGTVPLERWKGTSVDLEFELCDVGNDNTLAWAKRLWLTRAREVPRATSQDGPDLLVLMVDTLRADHLGAYGYGRDTSPTLDWLAEDSRVFDRAISPSSWTLPSVASLLTGDAPVVHGVIEGVPLRTPSATIGEALQEAGFTTFGFSANPLVGRLEGMHRGFETFLQVPFAPAEEVNRVFLDWLADHEGARWFAYLHYIDPHSPYAAPAPWNDRYTEGCRTRFTQGFALQTLSDAVNFGKEPVEFEAGDIACLMDGYDAEIRYWDDQLGRLLGVLKNRGELDDTVVVVTGDHGEEFLDHDRLGHGYHLYEESIRVPLVIHASGRLAPDRKSEPVETGALKEALLSLLNLRSGGGEGGALLAPAGDGEPWVFSHTTESYVIGKGYTTLASVQGPRWKYILRPEDGSEELYDLESDLAERSNLAASEPEIRERYRETLEAWLSGGTPRSETRGLDDRTLEKLRALGYIR